MAADTGCGTTFAVYGISLSKGLKQTYRTSVKSGKACWSFDIHLLRSYCQYGNHPNPKVQEFYENSLVWNPSQDFSHLFEFIFDDTEFVIHCGAHKTATTYMQACLNENRYELAMNGII